MRILVAARARVKKFPNLGNSKIMERNQKLYEMENIDISGTILYDDLNRFLNAHNVLAASAARLFLYKSICIEQYGFTVNPLFLLKHSETISLYVPIV